MSDDDSKKPVFFTPSGKFAKGHPGWNKGKQSKSDTQSDTPTAEPYLGDPDDSDAVIIYVARNFGRKGLPRDGQIGYYLWLMEERPADFNAQHSKAIARKAETQASAAFIPISYDIVPCPSGYFVPHDEAKAAWEKRAGMKLSGDAPPPTTPKPVLVQPRDDDNKDEPPPSDDEQSPEQSAVQSPEQSAEQSKPYALMSGPELAAALANNGEIAPRDTRPRARTGIDMNDMLRGLPKTKWKRDEPWE